MYATESPCAHRSQVKLQELQDESEGEIERLESLLASINAEYTTVVAELDSAAPGAMPMNVRVACTCSLYCNSKPFSS